MHICSVWIDRVNRGESGFLVGTRYFATISSRRPQLMSFRRVSSTFVRHMFALHWYDFLSTSLSFTTCIKTFCPFSHIENIAFHCCKTNWTHYCHQLSVGGCIATLHWIFVFEVTERRHIQHRQLGSDCLNSGKWPVKCLVCICSITWRTSRFSCLDGCGDNDS